MALNILKITLPPCNTALDCQFDVRPASLELSEPSKCSLHSDLKGGQARLRQDLYGNRKVRIRVGGRATATWRGIDPIVEGITIPSGGFFAQRLAAQARLHLKQKVFFKFKSELCKVSGSWGD